MTDLLRDIRYAFRMLGKNPVFTAVSVLALALGIGANSAIFTVVNAVLLRPLPYKDPAGLAVIWEKNIPRNRNQNVVSPANFHDWKDQNQAFERIAAFAPNPLNLTSGGEPERVIGALATGDFFGILGVPPFLGRTFTPQDDTPEAQRVVVLSHGLWQRRFGGQTSMIGQTISMHGRVYEVIGVMPAGFGFPAQSEFWFPARFDADDRVARGRFLQVIGRLKPGVSVEQAHAEMTALAARLEQQSPRFNAGWSANVFSLTEQVVGNFRSALGVLVASVGVVLLIACANIANLLLARATTRNKEVAIRAALGARRGRVIRQLLTESTLLALLGGIAGLLLGYWGTRLLVAMNPGNIPRLGEIGVDSTALGFTFAVSLITGIVFGLIPAIQASRTDLQDSLKEGGKTSGSGSHRHWLRNSLVVAEIAMALVLLIGAGLLFGSFLRLRDTRAGFNPDGVLTVDLSLPSAKYGESHQQTGFFRDLLERIKTLPGVQHVGAISSLPLAGPGSATSFYIEGAPAPAPGQAPVADVRAVTPDFFRSMGIALKRGRVVTERDGADAPLAVVINESMVNTFWPNEDPIGKRINMPWGEPMVGEIVGIVEDVRFASLDSAPRATLYWPFQQFPFGFMTIVIRTAGDPMALVPAVRTEVLALDKEQPIASVRTMEEVMAASVARPRFNSTLLMIFAAVALVLASVGIYGVMSFSVTQRTHEIGLRLAMGAKPVDVLRAVVVQGMTLALAGIVLGLIASAALSRFLTGLLYEIKPTDSLTYVTVSITLLAVAFVANFIPARRATRIDPLIALRYE